MVWKRVLLLVKISIRESDIWLEDGKREGWYKFGFNVIFSVIYYDIKLFLMGEGGTCY